MKRLIINVHMPDAEAVDAFAQMEARAIHALVRSPGTTDQSNSYALLLDEDGTTEDQWHVDDFGIVRSGEPDADEPPAWVPVTGGHDAYPGETLDGQTTRVQHNGDIWINVHGDGNSWEPGAFGWEVDNET